MRAIILCVIATLLTACASSRSFLVSLEENPTTGYTLVWEQQGEGEVTLQEEHYTPSKGTLLGAGGVHTFRFKGIRPGMVTLKFQHARPWEPKEKAIESESYLIVVHDDLSVTL